jgi:S1 RNA binding domain/Zc3h12a-like Ribonuclease NYN domain
VADRFVIDGSNLATEGRTEPSLAQLKEAVAAFRAEHPGAVTTVVVDASFEHRIDPSERAEFAKTEAANEVVSPPAGAVGRGDGFLLQIADRVGAAVLSNDSFQEFHADYDWLFEPGRLIGGKPVPGVGWIFSLRRPVRGIVSRKTIQKAKQEDKTAKPDKKVQKAIAEATASAMEGDSTKRRRRRGGRGRSSGKTEESEPEAVNEPATFLQFVIDHRLGTDVDGEVDSFASHGAFVIVDGVKCYVPLSAMGNPQPTRARDVLTKGDKRTFVVQAVDAPRRGIELGLPGFATVAGAPSEETVAAEVGTRRTKTKKSTPAKKPAKATKRQATEQSPAKQQAPDAKSAKKSRAAKRPATKVPTATPAKKVTKKVAKGAAKTAPAMAEPPVKKAKGARKQKSTKQTAKSEVTPAPAKAAAKPANKAEKKAAKQTAKRTAKATKKAPAAAEKPLSQVARQARKRR